MMTVGSSNMMESNTQLQNGIQATAPNQKLYGYVKFFIAEKGFGFITANDGNDYFVHFKSIQMNGHKSLATGEQVEFGVACDPVTGKLAAQNVTGPNGAAPQGQPPQNKSKGSGKGGFSSQDSFGMNGSYGNGTPMSVGGYGMVNKPMSVGTPMSGTNMYGMYQQPQIMTPSHQQQMMMQQVQMQNQQQMMMQSQPHPVHNGQMSGSDPLLQ